MLCHKEPSQLRRLLSEIIKDNCDCYVHIDKKSCFSKNDLVLSEHVKYVLDEQRVDVRWASNSMVRATLILINMMLNSGRRYDYVCLLSGQDFPIKSCQQREAFFDRYKGYNFIEVINNKSISYQRLNKRSQLYYPDCMFDRTLVSKLLRKLYIMFTGGYNRTWRICRRKNTSGLDTFEYGGQWWCLTYECVQWMQNFIEDKVNLEFFDHALTPDECFFQSVFMMSPYKNLRRDGIMYYEWKKDRNSPKILRTTDYDALVNQLDKLFARKFDITIDDEIIKRLEQL